MTLKFRVKYHSNDFEAQLIESAIVVLVYWATGSPNLPWPHGVKQIYVICSELYFYAAVAQVSNTPKVEKIYLEIYSDMNLLEVIFKTYYYDFRYFGFSMEDHMDKMINKN